MASLTCPCPTLKCLSWASPRGRKRSPVEEVRMGGFLSGQAATLSRSTLQLDLDIRL